jgi:hypothetical protein
MESVLAAEISVREAAGRFNLPRSQLQDSFENNDGHVEKIFKKISHIPDASKQRLKSRRENLTEVKF